MCLVQAELAHMLQKMRTMMVISRIGDHGNAATRFLLGQRTKPRYSKHVETFQCFSSGEGLHNRIVRFIYKKAALDGPPFFLFCADFFFIYCFLDFLLFLRGRRAERANKDAKDFDQVIAHQQLVGDLYRIGLGIPMASEIEA